jgi:hypothetical protein
MATEKLKKEYDFSRGVRGKFHRPGARLRLPVYLEERALARVQRIAGKKGTDISTVVNQMILNDRRHG